MKLALLLLICLLCLTHSSTAQLNYSKVRVFVPNDRLEELSDLGIEMDHGTRKQGVWLDTDLSDIQIQSLEDHQFNYTILIEDVQDYYVQRNAIVPLKSDREDCGDATSSAFDPITPANFSLGSYAGYYTYQEFLDELDDMYAQYPDLITQRTAIDTFTTHEGRSIYWLRMSDNANIDEAENEVLYTALHHAREPASLSQLIFFMWYMLENYGADPEVTYLLDNTELYFVPMLNPDGYIYNEVNSPNGGGLHRKNKRNIGTFNPGVDLNRNYSYFWNVSGTTPDVNGDTYPGTHAFSEPETQAIKYFCENRDFEFALNAHTYGNLLLFPIGYATNVFAQDHDYFQTFANHQVLFSNYDAVKATDLYPAAGDSDDWMYADDLATKPKIYALTPEIGTDSDGFWPPQHRITPLAKENVWMNLVQAHMPHVYGVTTNLDPERLTTSSGYFHYNYERLGLQNGPVNISITPLQNIQSIGGQNVHNLNLMDIVNDSISFTLSNSIAFGDEVKYVVNTDFGLWTRTDTIIKQYGSGQMAFIDNCNNISNWSGSWTNTDEYYVSSNFSITDSPFSNYNNNSTTNSELVSNVTFTNATYAYAQFNARWEIETDWDYVEFMISIDNGNSWIPLCGNYTNLGNSNQDDNEPLYDGFQSEWVLEEVDLSSFIGIANPKFKFKLVSDQFVTEDGFAYDDFKVFTDGNTLNLADQINPNAIAVYPNPTSGLINIVTTQDILRLELYDQLGQLLYEQAISNEKVTLNVSNFENGIYFIRCYDHAGQFIVKKIVVQQ